MAIGFIVTFIFVFCVFGCIRYANEKIRWSIGYMLFLLHYRLLYQFGLMGCYLLVAKLMGVKNIHSLQKPIIYPIPAIPRVWSLIISK